MRHPPFEHVVATVLLAVASMVAAPRVLAAPGDLDTSFGTGGKVIVSFASPGPDSATALARDAAGYLYVGGNGHSALGGGSTDFAIAKLDQGGQLVSSFGSGGKLLINVSTYNDIGTSLVIAGAYGYIGGSTTIGSSRVFVVSKFDLDGRLVTSFGTGGTRIVDFGPNTASYVEAITVDTNGNLFLAGGTLIPPSADYALAVTQLDPTGAPVSGFGNGGTSIIPTSGFSSTYTALTPDGAGGLYLAATRYATSATSIALHRLGPNGLPVSAFGTGGRVVVNFTGNHDEVNGLSRASNGDLYLAGTMLDFSNVRRIGVAKIGANGVLASGYGTAGKVMLGLAGHSLEGNAMALAQDGSVYVVGVDESSTSVDYLVAAFGSAGSVDSGFGTAGSTAISFSTGNDFGRAALLDGNGHLYVTGDADGSSSSSHFGIARLLVPRPETIFRSGFEP